MIERHSDLSYEAFVRNYLKAERPVIITDATRSWDAIGKWTPEFFSTEFADQVLPVNSSDLSVKDLIGQILEATENNPSPYFLGTGPGRYLVDVFPELTSDITPKLVYLEPNWLEGHFWPAFLTERMNRGPKAEIYIGGLDSGHPSLHWDSLHFMVFACQIYGEKEWTAFAPEDTKWLYPKPTDKNTSLVDNIEDPDLERFPLFAQATAHKFVLRPGDTIFLPPGWWHITHNPGPSISVSFNCANAVNWSRVTRSYVSGRPIHKALTLGASLTASGILRALHDVFAGERV